MKKPSMFTNISQFFAFSRGSQQQALVLGYAVPMPVVVRTRPFDSDFYRALGAADDTLDPVALKRRGDKARADLFGPPDS
jgi:DNA helicase HerA-like ATPase